MDFSRTSHHYHFVSVSEEKDGNSSQKDSGVIATGYIGSFTRVMMANDIRLIVNIIVKEVESDINTRTYLMGSDRARLEQKDGNSSQKDSGVVATGYVGSFTRVMMVNEIRLKDGNSSQKDSCVVTWYIGSFTHVMMVNEIRLCYIIFFGELVEVGHSSKDSGRQVFAVSTEVSHDLHKCANMGEHLVILFFGWHMLIDEVEEREGGGNGKAQKVYCSVSVKAVDILIR
ncbi:hypothetical protein TorRG33x02_235450 [Trema orientale]|uniref:Uncharacterized protein n=1 Tax=Trema orientale TaxID=63057 RepID=A0A2P5E226_TREOI|nr:hypothetical protein TorRG33x02_235450 [Trema orientale]